MAKAKEKDVLMDHNYDGIHELDNDLPPWWLYLFYITIVWAVIYLVHYHVIGSGDSSYAEYMKEMDPNWKETIQASTGLVKSYSSPYAVNEADLTPRKRVEMQIAQIQAERERQALAAAGGTETVKVEQLSFKELIQAAMVVATPDELTKLKNTFPDYYAELESKDSATPAVVEAAPVPKLEALTDIASLQKGETIFQTNCAVCHGKLGEGGIGPNFTDDYWIHGAGMDNMVRVILNGVPAKGMITWRPILKNDQVQQVSSYIITLRGTNPPNAKAPQGDKVEYN